MEIFPQVTRKLLGDCAAGELIRRRWGEGQQYGLVAAGEEGQYLVLFSVNGDEQSPGIALLERPDLPAISYGNSYRIEVDQSTENVDLTGRRLWEKSGALMIANSHYILHLMGLPNSRFYGSHYLQLDTGTLVPEPVGGVAIFERWSLMLPKGGNQYEMLLTVE